MFRTLILISLILPFPVIAKFDDELTKTPPPVETENEVHRAVPKTTRQSFSVREFIAMLNDGAETNSEKIAAAHFFSNVRQVERIYTADAEALQRSLLNYLADPDPQILPGAVRTLRAFDQLLPSSFVSLAHVDATADPALSRTISLVLRTFKTRDFVAALRNPGSQISAARLIRKYHPILVNQAAPVRNAILASIRNADPETVADLTQTLLILEPVPADIQSLLGFFRARQEIRDVLFAQLNDHVLPPMNRDNFGRYWDTERDPADCEILMNLQGPLPVRKRAMVRAKTLGKLGDPVIRAAIHRLRDNSTVGDFGETVLTETRNLVDAGARRSELQDDLTSARVHVRVAAFDEIFSNYSVDASVANAYFSELTRPDAEISGFLKLADVHFDKFGAYISPDIYEKIVHHLILKMRPGERNARRASIALAKFIDERETPTLSEADREIVAQAAGRKITEFGAKKLLSRIEIPTCEEMLPALNRFNSGTQSRIHPNR